MTDIKQTYDEYMQERIYRVYIENKKGFFVSGQCKSFDEYVKRYGSVELAHSEHWLLNFGCGQQRAKDYAQYIADWLMRTWSL